MYTIYIMRRTQIYLDPAQAAELAIRARRRGVTSSHMIREAIEHYLAEPGDDPARRLASFRAAVDRSFGTVPRLEDGASFTEDLRRADRQRAEALEARRRE